MITPKERYMAAIHHEELDRVPIYAGLDAKFVELITGKRHASAKSYIGGGVPVAKEVSSPTIGSGLKAILPSTSTSTRSSTGGEKCTGAYPRWARTTGSMGS